MTSRRHFLHCGLVTGAGAIAPLLSLRQAPAAEASSTADAVVFVNLAGGPSHLDTLDVKPDAPAETRGEFQSIQTKIPGLSACEHLPKFAAAANQFTLIRGISHTTGDHPQGQAYIASGNRPGPALKHPSYGSIVAKQQPGSPTMPVYVAIPQTEWGAGYLGDGFAPLKTNAVPTPGKPFAVRGITLPAGVDIEKVQRRERLLSKLNKGLQESGAAPELVRTMQAFGELAHQMVTSPETAAAFDVSREPPAIAQLFDSGELGQSLLLATRLVSRGVRFVTVTNPGWDTHLDNFRGHRRLLGPLDAGITALLEALRGKGLLGRTLVVIMGEFGRTPKINANAGRDHYPRPNWCLMAGGGVQPGQLIGGTDPQGAAPDDDTQIKPDDIGATILTALGIDPATEFYTRTGRPVSLIPHGKPLAVGS